MPHQISRSRILFQTILLASILLAGCASTPPPKTDFEPPVYPPPPAEPRFIYERSLHYNDDVEEFSRMQRFKLYATGASKKLHGMLKPFDVAVSQGRVYVSDTVQRAVLLFDIPGKRFIEIGTREPGELAKPLGLAISSLGELFVVDTGNKCVMVYDLDGRYLRRIGNREQLRKPSDVAISPDGKLIYVVDTGGIDSQSHHIHIYDAQQGHYIKKIGQRGLKDGEFNLPLQATVSNDGTLHVVDSGNFRIQSFTADGEFISKFGSAGRYPGQFARPKGIASDADGNLYVVDTAFGNIQIFTADGQLLMFLGQRGHAGYPGKFMLPAGIAIDELGKIYVVDQFFRKIDIFAPYQKHTPSLPAAEPAAK